MRFGRLATLAALAYAQPALGAPQSFYVDPDPELQAAHAQEAAGEPGAHSSSGAASAPAAPAVVSAARATPSHLQVLTEEAQVLAVTSQGNCISQKGQLVKISANYHTTDGQSASALSFKIKWDPNFFEPVGAKKEHAPSGCVVDTLDVDNAAGTAAYTCASPDARPIVPDRLHRVVTVTLRAILHSATTGTKGSPLVSIHPNAKLPGSGYSYAPSVPMNLGCDRNTEKQLQAVYATCGAGKYGRAVRWRASGSGSADVQMAKAECVPCPVGRYNAGDSKDHARCKPCAAGSYASNQSATACKLCAAGAFAPTAGLGACTKCATGKHAASAGAAACNLCGIDKAGMFADVEGLTACKTCPDGTFSWLAGAVACGVGEGCSPGRYHARSTTEGFHCEKCPIGKYAPLMNAVSCKDCAVGRYQMTPGQNECEPSRCTAGEFYDAKRYPGCGNCPAGKFSVLKDGVLFPGTSCQACPHGQYQWKVGSPSCYESNCLPGSYQFKFSRECVGCAAGQFQPFLGQGSCLKCPEGTHSKAGSTKCESLQQNAELAAALVKSRLPGPCSHMVCRLEAHSCHTTYLKTGFMRGKMVRDCTSRAIDSAGMERAKHEHHAGQWVSVRSYHQSKEVKGTSHRCGFQKATGKCECICWTEAPGGAAQQPEAP